MIQDFNLTLDPGETRPLTFGAVDFVFCRLADQPIDFIVEQETTEMETGGEFESRDGLFDRALVRNKSKTRPATVKLKMGTSRYRQVIIQGEVVVDPRVKLATGEFVSDQRADHQVLVTMDYKREPGIAKGSTTEEYSFTKRADGRPIDAVQDLVTGINYFFFWDNFFDELDVYALDDTGVINSTLAMKPALTDLGGASFQSRVSVFNGQASVMFTDGSAKYVATYPSPFSINGTVNYTRIDQLLAAAGSEFSADQIFHGKDGSLYIGNIADEVYLIQGNSATLVGSYSDPASFTSPTVLLKNDAAAVFIGFPDRVELYNGIFESKKTSISFANIDNTYAGMGIGEFSDGRIMVLDGDPNGTGVTVYSIEPKAYEAGELHWGSASEYCLSVPGLMNTALQNNTRSDAAVSVTWSNGQAFASGEIIKYTLDILGIDTSGDYLDGLTGFQATTKTGEIILDLGGRTLSADSIEDDFQDVELPQTLRFTALNSLWSDRA